MKRFTALLVAAVLITAIFAVPVCGAVKADITQFGSDVTVPAGQVEEGSVTVFGGNAIIDGEVKRDVTVFGGNLTINGRVGRNATDFGGNVTLGGNSVINGDLTYFGGRLDRDPRAQVKGNISAGVPRFNPFTSFIFGLLSLIGMLAIAALIVALWPNATSVLADTIEREPLQSLGVGFLTVVLIPFAIGALAVTIVGIPLIFLLLFAIPFVFLYGYTGSARWLGRRIGQNNPSIVNAPVLQVVIGTLIIGVIGFIPVLGWLVSVVAVLFGLGAVILSKFGTGRPWFGRRAAPPPTEEAAKGAA
ncbi:MAG: polymer-forming cytoskeletal protein [Firmicutes bacterium]|nr:polymer-forming cytoskeletal protein [Bacillota bacterium]